MSSVKVTHQDRIQDGIKYAEETLLDQGGHLEIDKRLLKKHFDFNGKTVMDFGCGVGGMSIWMANHLGAIVDGYDIDEKHIEVAFALLKKYPTENVTFSQKNIIENPIDKEYDVIILNDVIEHIKPDWIPGILTILVNRNLKKGGLLYFSYPPWEGPYASHMQRVINVPWLQYMPQKMLVNMIRKRNQTTLGQYDLVQEYLELNHMTHKKLMKFMEPLPVEPEFRYSHTKLNKINLFANTSFYWWPAKHLISKEFITFRKK
ncbi:MAG TPA: methyltransferase domain-containing protein [Cyclobacteriaceae bacterium]|nr:methyltransferase domain-containing protein [Cyclobacteriaceae bacterium]HRJ83506.1 methyltransferase domain-containing protein [Cyclobacteriaceae bacterium]